MLDILTLGVGIKDKDPTVLPRNLGAFDVSVQLSSQKGHVPLLFATVPHGIVPPLLPSDIKAVRSRRQVDMGQVACWRLAPFPDHAPASPPTLSRSGAAKIALSE